MISHLKCERTLIKCNKGQHDISWRNPSKEWFKLKNNIETKIKEFISIEDGCSIRRGIKSIDDKYYWIHEEHKLRLEIGEKVILTPTKNYPSYMWIIRRN